MFANAYEIARKFTMPVIISLRYYSGKVNCSCGAFIVLNDEGWILTTAHIFNSYLQYGQHKKQMQKYEEEKKAIMENPGYDQKQKKKRIAHLKIYPGWILNHSFWWGMDGAILDNIKILKEGDIMVGQLKPFDKTKFREYPRFMNPVNMKIATSLCKLGYPFHRIEAHFDEDKHRFEIKKEMIPTYPYPIEGIYTRELFKGITEDGKYRMSFLETSTPGLMGQSGGPIFDTNGVVWAVQSRTLHHPLGFSPKIVTNGKEIVENQFLNVGVGIHSGLIRQFLKNNDIKFESAD